MDLDEKRLKRIVQSFADVELLVVGDVILDEYLWGDVDRISPEAPVPVVHVTRESMELGGAGNVVRSIVALGGRSKICALVGDDRAGKKVVDLFKDLGVDPNGLVIVEGRPTTRKTRVVARSQQMVRFDRETDEAPPSFYMDQLLQVLGSSLASVQGVILEDYGKGLLSAEFLSAAMQHCQDAGAYVAVDPKDELVSYRGASLFKPNLREAENLTHMRIRSREDLEKARVIMRESIGDGDVVITQGSEGMSLFEKDAPVQSVHTAAREVFDVQGAGDTVIAALVLSMRSGASLLEAAVIANAAAGVVVKKIGTATASPEEIYAMLPDAIAAAQG